MKAKLNLVKSTILILIASCASSCEDQQADLPVPTGSKIFSTHKLSNLKQQLIKEYKVVEDDRIANDFLKSLEKSKPESFEIGEETLKLKANKTVDKQTSQQIELYATRPDLVSDTERGGYDSGGGGSASYTGRSYMTFENDWPYSNVTVEIAYSTDSNGNITSWAISTYTTDSSFGGFDFNALSASAHVSGSSLSFNFSGLLYTGMNYDGNVYGSSYVAEYTGVVSGDGSTWGRQLIRDN